MIHARPDYMRFQDPLGKIADSEPVFLMRAQDRGFVPILRCAISIYRSLGAHDVADRLEPHLLLAERWQAENPTKVPDLPPGVASEGEATS